MSDSEKTVLLPCPFCGGNADFFERFHSSGRPAGFDICCASSYCMASDGFDWVMDKDELAKLWNRRATIDGAKVVLRELGFPAV